MKVNLTEKITIVTGAGQGIGEAIAKRFADAGAIVIVATRTRKNGQETVDAIRRDGGQASLFQVDIGDRQQVRDLIAHTVEAYGGVDILIHNAAIFPIAGIEKLSDEELDDTLSVNLKAAFWLTRETVPLMRARGWGRLLFTSSVTGPRVAMPETSHYAASKGGLNGFIRTAALEFARDNITVNGIEPGYILTQAMSALVNEEELTHMAEQIPLGALGKPEDIADAMLFLASREAGYITGQTLVVDGGSTLPENPLILEQFYRQRPESREAADESG
ncbi:MAG: SDR family oxidoreductase [Gammaproteobacteria bacterium]